MKLRLTHEAEGDLEAIGDYIARESPRKALEFVQLLRSRCMSIVDAPLAYAVTPRYETRGVRRRVVGSYLIFYKIDQDTIYVIRILHGASDYAALLFRED